jgi:acetyltransferase-like isoleucine patch superfamily enzyme
MFFPLIAETAQVNAFVTVDAGIEQPTLIGAGTFLMAHVHVGHDAQIGDDCELAPGTVIGGHAVLEEGVRCGIGVLVLPRRRIGRGARLGAGAVVAKDVPAGAVYAGNPAKPLRAATEPLLTACEEQGWEELALAAGVDQGWIDWWNACHVQT